MAKVVIRFCDDAIPSLDTSIQTSIAIYKLIKAHDYSYISCCIWTEWSRLWLGGLGWRVSLHSGLLNTCTTRQQTHFLHGSKTHPHRCIRCPHHLMMTTKMRMMGVTITSLSFFGSAPKGVDEPHVDETSTYLGRGLLQQCHWRHWRTFPKCYSSSRLVETGNKEWCFDECKDVDGLSGMW